MGDDKKKKAGSQSRAEIQAELNQLRDDAEQCVAEAAEIDELAKAEGRELTEDECERIEALVAEGEEKRADYEQRLKEDRRAALRASIEMGRERIEGASDPTSVFSTPATRRVTHLKHRFYDDPKRGFDDLGEFCAAIFTSGLPNAGMDERLGKIRLEAAASGMSQAVGADGGILVPPSFRNQIWDGMQGMTDNLLPMTDQYPVVGDSLVMPANGETSRANGSRFGGIRAFWVAEGDQVGSSKPKVRNLKLEPQELAALVYVTDKLLRNAPALNTYVTKASTEEILFVISDAIINGSGVGKPLGILNSNGLVTVAKETGQAAETILLANINKMWSRMHPKPRANSVWLINQDCEEQLESLSAVVGTGGFPVYLPQGASGPTITESPNARLKGRPVLPIEQCQTVGTKGDIMLVNLTYYATGMKGAMRDDVSMHLRFDYLETAFRFTFELDGQPWVQTPLTPFKGNNTKSAYVALADRA